MSEPRWVNVYSDDQIGFAHSSRAAADKCVAGWNDGSTQRVACIKVTPKPTRKP